MNSWKENNLLREARTDNSPFKNVIRKLYEDDFQIANVVKENESTGHADIITSDESFLVRWNNGFKHPVASCDSEISISREQDSSYFLNEDSEDDEEYVAYVNLCNALSDAVRQYK